VPRSQLHSLQSRIRELTGQVEERDARLAALATRLQEANNNKKELAKYKVSHPCALLCFSVLQLLRIQILVGKIRIQETKIEKGEEMSCFERLNVPF
jgi:hypothetical protein